MPDEKVRTLTLVCLLKDTGCSSSSSRVHKIFGGDDHLAKTVVKFIDWSSPGESFRSSVKYAAPSGQWGSWLRRLSRGFRWPRQVMQEIGESRRVQGAEIAAELGCSAEVIDIIRTLDEHWDGRGAPQGVKGERIPLGARIVGVAQVFDVFASRFGMTAAFAVLEERSGRWFDPHIIKATDTFSYETEFWNQYSQLLRTGTRILPGLDKEQPATEEEMDRVCRVFARIIDAKSTFSRGHSTRVASLAENLAKAMGYGEERLATLRRAAWLHDIGKLGVPSSILDKAERLLPEESAAFRAQVRYTQLVLQPIPGFERISEISFAHHDGLDGEGFWRGLSIKDLDQDQQILAAADVFDALVSERPYKPAMPTDRAIEILTDACKGALDTKVIEELGTRRVA